MKIFFFSRVDCQQKEREGTAFASVALIFLSPHNKKPAPQVLAHKPVTLNTHRRQIPLPRGPQNPGQVLRNTPKYAANHLQASGLHPTKRTNGTQRHTAQADGERSVRTQGQAPERRAHSKKLADSSRVTDKPGTAARPGRQERARVHSYAHSDTHTDAVTYVMHMEKPYPSQSPPRPPHHSPPPAPGSPQPRAPLAEEARVPAGCGAQGRGPAAGGSEASVPGPGGLGGQCGRSFGNAPAAGPQLQPGRRRRRLQLLGNASSVAGPQPGPGPPPARQPPRFWGTGG